jgi:lipoate-protein ligase A
MLFIKRVQTDPYFNLAAEEYLLKEFQEDTFSLWRNERAVVIGKHQNTLAEINPVFVKDANIKVVRRFSGGGAVFHDLGNLNFTYTRTISDRSLIYFRMFMEPLLEVLRNMGIDARLDGKSDMTITGKKFSGNAMHIWKNKVLHHGTLLFSSDLSDLRQALQSDRSRFDDKAVKSRYTSVTNIIDHLKEPIDIRTFAERIQQHMISLYPGTHQYDWNEEDIRNIMSLIDKKYAKWEWNYGYSPKYKVHRVLRARPETTLELILHVQDGIIRDVRILGNGFNEHDSEEIKQALTGIAHREEHIKKALYSLLIHDNFAHLDLEELLACIF